MEGKGRDVKGETRHTNLSLFPATLSRTLMAAFSMLFLLSLRLAMS